MQPLDVAVMGPLKTYYCQEIENWVRANPGRVVSPYKIAGLLGKAYLRTASLEISINGFRKCGIMPFDRSKFRGHDFSIHEKLETPREIENIIQRERPANDIDEATAENEPAAQKPKPKVTILQNISLNPNVKPSIKPIVNKENIKKIVDMFCRVLSLIVLLLIAQSAKRQDKE